MPESETLSFQEINGHMWIEEKKKPITYRLLKVSALKLIKGSLQIQVYDEKQKYETLNSKAKT